MSPSDPTRVLVVGSGGREHALLRALARSPRRPHLLVAPGNPGMRADAELLAVHPDDANAVAAAACDARVDLVVVGPEAPLVAGLADACAAAGLPCFGPSAAAARLEGSKAFAKEVMAAARVPTGGHVVVEDVEAGLRAVTAFPAVIKADGLAAGKGVFIVADEVQARAALQALLGERRFDTERVVVEEYLEGPELSLLALCDGERAVPMAPARDFKRLLEGDGGPNTGGMGSYSPVPEISDDEVSDLCARVHQPVVDELAGRGTPLHGILYAGLILTSSGPRVLEFNVRFGDPETQAVLPRLRTDLLGLLEGAVRPGGLTGVTLDWSPAWSVCVVLAGPGYPDEPVRGAPISGLDRVPPGADVLHAGVALQGGRLVASGGRILDVVGAGATAREARASAYAGADVVDFPGKRLRRDIAAAAEHAV